jgi:hypothetical protein
MVVEVDEPMDARTGCEGRWPYFTRRRSSRKVAAICVELVDSEFKISHEFSKIKQTNKNQKTKNKITKNK